MVSLLSLRFPYRWHWFPPPALGASALVSASLIARQIDNCASGFRCFGATHHFLSFVNLRWGDFIPSLGFCVWCRVGARFSRTRDGNMTSPHKTIPRPLGIVGARIERGHLLPRCLDCARCFFLTMAGKLSHWPSLGTMANHLSASSSVVNSR